MKTLLAIVHSSSSHLGAFRRLLNMFEKEGNYRIVLVTTRLGLRWIKSYGYEVEFLNVMPFGSNFEKYIARENSPDDRYHKELQLRSTNYLYHYRTHELSELVRRYNPSVVLIDILLSTDILIIEQFDFNRGIKYGIVSTKVNPLRRSEVPPYTSYYMGKNRLIIALCWVKGNVLKMLRNILIVGRFAGSNPIRDVREAHDRIKGSSKVGELVQYNCTGIAFTRVSYLFLIPESFEFPWFRIQDNHTYLGFLGNKSDSIDVDMGVVRFLKESKRRKSTIVYCSFGTLHNWDVRKLKRFIGRVLDLVEKREDIDLILAIKRENYRDVIFKSERILWLDYAPQMYILERSDIFITHGGINSIKEAIHTLTPMIVYPLDRGKDQFGNAARVVFHNLGLRGWFSDSSRTIEGRIKDLLSDYTRHLEVLKAFKKQEQEREESETWMKVSDALEI